MTAGLLASHHRESEFEPRGNPNRDSVRSDRALDGATGSDQYVIDLDSGRDVIKEFDPIGDDRDVLNINTAGFDRSWLWLERVNSSGVRDSNGSDLLISVLESSSQVRVEGWFTTAPGAPGNRMLEFIIGGNQVAFDVDAISALMASFAKPASRAAHWSLIEGNSAYGSDWASLWKVNERPILGAISAQTTSEDAVFQLPLTVSDDFTDIDQLRYTIEAYSDAAFTQLSVVRCFETFSAAALRGLGSSGFDPKRRAVGAASGDWRWSCV